MLSEVRMRKNRSRKILLSFFLFSLFCLGSLWCQQDRRFFDDALPLSDDVRLTVLYPSLGDLRAFEQLRNQGLIPIKNLTVVGLYHEKQLTTFAGSIRYAQNNDLDWLKFHRLEGDLELEMLFEHNALSEELYKIFSCSDGILFFGGADIPASVYREKTHLLTNITTPFRSYLDTTVIFHLLGGWQDKNFTAYCESRPEFTVLGLCLGCQSINVGTGGTLVQDIPSEIYGKNHIEDIIAMSQEDWHKNPFAMLYPREFRSSNLHRIKLAGDGKFVRDWGFKKEDEPLVYSSHHQTLQKLGKGIRVIATSLDGRVAEAIEHTVHANVLGVQFHPEARSLWDKDIKSRLTPEEEKTDFLSILESNPPSLAFHKKIWSWFSQKLKASHRMRNTTE